MIGWIFFGIIFLYLYNTSQYTLGETGIVVAVIAIIGAIVFDKFLHKEVTESKNKGGVLYIPNSQN